MKRAAVFFDRDNTLVACDEYLGDPDKVELVSGAADAVARARKLGYATVTISNQSGVARGYFDENAVHAVNARLDEVLAAADARAVIDRHEFCPYHPEASIERYRQPNSPMRKPAPGMLLSAADALDLDLSKSWVIGDAPRDIEAGQAAGCRTILFTDPSLKTSPAANEDRRVEPQYICSTLAEAMDFIERNTEKPQLDMEIEATASTSEAPASSQTVPTELPPEDNVEPSPDTPAPTEPAKTESTTQTVGEAFSTGPTVEPADAPIHEETTWRRTGILEEPGTPESSPADTSRLESIAGDILHELRRQREQPVSDFSVSKLLGGVLQMLVLLVLFIAYFARSEPQTLQSMLLLALVLQAMTIALLIMGKQK